MSLIKNKSKEVAYNLINKYIHPRDPYYIKNEAIKEYHNIVTERTTYPFSEIYSLAQSIEPFATDDEHLFNSMYGHSYVLKRYAGLNDRFLIKASIPHGIQFGERYHQSDISSNKTMFAWGKHNEAYQKRQFSDSEIITIGAPFFYAESLLSIEEIEKEKKRLGRNLLIFPAHSTFYKTVNYDVQSIINRFSLLKEQFDTIRVCLYWRDILENHIDEIYTNAGFECVTCGHRGDYNFLRRLKSLILVSDATCSNKMGSHVGYSVFLDKPHLLIKSDVYIIGEDDETTAFMKDKNYVRLLEVFEQNYDFLITEEQKVILDLYWGKTKVKSPFELREIFTSI